MDKKEVKYMVRLNYSEVDRDEFGYMFRQTRCDKIFCAILINFSSTHLYFELDKDKDVVIVPHRWVEWMAPVKEVLKEGETNGKNSNN